MPDLSIAATDRPLRPGQYVYVETHAWWLTTHGPHQLPGRAPPPPVGPGRSRAGVGARPRGHRGAGVAHRLGRGGPRRRLRPAARDAGRPCSGPATVRSTWSACVTEGTTTAGAPHPRPTGQLADADPRVLGPPPARSRDARAAAPRREHRQLVRPVRGRGDRPAHLPRARRPARDAVPRAGLPARRAGRRRASRTSTAWRASRSSTTPGAPAPS